LFLLLFSLLIGQGQAVRTVENGGVTVTQKTLGQCTALAPADWQMVGTSPQADAVDLSSGDQRSYAGWGIRGVNRQMQAYYGDAYGDPITSSRFLVNMIGQKTFGETGPFNYTSQQLQLGGGFIAAELQSTAHKAVIIYKLYPAPMLPAGSYIISLRIAIAPRNAPAMSMKTAMGVAAGINCTTMFRAPPAGDTQLPRPGDAFDRRRRGNETNDLEDYNAQLGTQYVHSPSTGQNYLVDRTAAWNDTGPDGPGFYRKVGNSYEKLEAGMR
jgi:hypothetical protein